MSETRRPANSESNTIANLPPLIATSVVRGSEQGQSHGGVYLIDPTAQAVRQVIDWNTADIDWSGRGWDRGLRGIAFWNEHVYIAASDELFVYDQQFQKQQSFRNRYLKHCHEITVFENRLYLTSTGFDTILAFDLLTETFSWGLHIKKTDGQWIAQRFDPQTEIGPPLSNQLHINNVQVDADGLCLAGLRTRGIVGLDSDASLALIVELPEGIHNARLTPNGVLFNDTAANFLRHVDRYGVEHQFRFPTYEPSELQGRGVDDSKIARQGFGRGLCMIDDRLVAAGSSPSTVSVFDLASEKIVFSVNFSMDIRNAIHGLAVWPYALSS